MNKSVQTNVKQKSNKKKRLLENANQQHKINLEKIEEEYQKITRVENEIFRENISDLDKKLFGLFFT